MLRVKMFILDMSLKITNLRLQLHLTGTNELFNVHYIWTHQDFWFIPVDVVRSYTMALCDMCKFDVHYWPGSYPLVVKS